MQDSSSPICPVPREQQPLNEYEALREAWPFVWATQARFRYGRKLLWVWAWSWAIAGPIAAGSFAPDRLPVRFFLAGAAGAGLGVFLMLLRLYSGWSYVRDRLERDAIVYEESGWYDGQTWPKPPEILARDRLVATHQVRPILDRVRGTLALVALLGSLGTAVWFLAALF